MPLATQNHGVMQGVVQSGQPCAWRINVCGGVCILVNSVTRLAKMPHCVNAKLQRVSRPARTHAYTHTRGAHVVCVWCTGHAMETSRTCTHHAVRHASRSINGCTTAKRGHSGKTRFFCTCAHSELQKPTCMRNRVYTHTHRNKRVWVWVWLCGVVAWVEG
jgi:hypothetical protein